MRYPEPPLKLIQSVPHNLIFSVEAPINVFKNQIYLLTDDTDSYSFDIPFPTYHRYIIKQKSYTEEKPILNHLK